MRYVTVEDAPELRDLLWTFEESWPEVSAIEINVSMHHRLGPVR